LKVGCRRAIDPGLLISKDNQYQKIGKTQKMQRGCLFETASSCFQMRRN